MLSHGTHGQPTGGTYTHAHKHIIQEPKLMYALRRTLIRIVVVVAVAVVVTVAAIAALAVDAVVIPCHQETKRNVCVRVHS